jgi:hypothetical protein
MAFDDPRPFGDFRKPGLEMPSIVPALGHEPGIYLYLPKPEHDNDPAIGSSAHRKLKIHPTDFYDTWPGNPMRSEDEETPAKLFGSAVHKCVLEGGKAALEKYYFPEPNGTVLRTIDDLKACLRAANYATTGLKAELVQRVRSNFPGIRIYDDIVAHHERAGRKMLKWDMWSRILKASLHISMHPTLARAFQGGRSEISIFWINSLGIRCKARLDYLRLVGYEHRGKPSLMASVSDLKSFASPQQIPIERAVENAAGSNISQAVHYLDAVRAAINMIIMAGTDAVLDHKPADRDWIKSWGECKRTRFHFVFYRSTGAPYSAATWHEPNDRLIEMARQGVLWNFQRFRECYEHFGPETPWVNLDEPRHLADEDSIKPWLL